MVLTDQGETRVLLVDDDEGFLVLASQMLPDRDGSLTVETESDPRRAYERVEEEPVDCVVCSEDLPGASGLELLRALREDHPELPFIVFASEGSEALACRASGAGASGYLRKGLDDQFELLADRVRDAVDAHRERVAVEETNQGLVDLLDRVSDGILVVQGGDVVFANRAASEWYDGDPVGAAPGEFLAGDAIDFQEWTDRLDDRDDAVEWGMVRVSTGEGERRMSLVGTPLHYEGRPALGVVFRTDVENDSG